MTASIDELLNAAKVIGGLVDRLIEMPEEHEANGRSALFLLMAQYYLQDLAERLQEGVDPYDAIIDTSKGIMPICT